MNALSNFTQRKPYSLVFEKGEIWLKLENDIFLFFEKDYPSISWFIFTMEKFEELDRKVIKALLPTGTVFFDIGANIGLHSLDVANEIPGAIVHAFEPVKNSYETLTKNIIKNGFKNIVTCNQIALAASSGTLSMTSSFHACNYVITAPSQCNCEEVKCTTVDEYVMKNDIKKLDFIKIDVECFEGEVLKGALKTLEEIHPFVFVEITKANSQEWSERRLADSQEIIKYMGNIGYAYYVLDDNDLIYSRENIKHATLANNHHNYLFYYFTFKNWFNVLLKIKNLISGNRIEQNLLDNIINEIENKKIIVFGAGGAYRENLQPVFIDCNIRPAYLIDNDNNKMNTTIEGIPILAVESLDYEDRASIYIFIASMYYDEIKEQLERKGFQEYQHFIQIN